jgi:hypothetical protein
VSFEYKIVKFDDLKPVQSHDLDIYEVTDKKDMDSKLTDRLNKLGKDGWELVFVMNDRFFLKKNI